MTTYERLPMTCTQLLLMATDDLQKRSPTCAGQERMEHRESSITSPAPEVDPVDEVDWLCSSDLDYFTQLAMYKRRQHGQGKMPPDGGR